MLLRYPTPQYNLTIKSIAQSRLLSFIQAFFLFLLLLLLLLLQLSDASADASGESQQKNEYHFISLEKVCRYCQTNTISRDGRVSEQKWIYNI